MNPIPPYAGFEAPQINPDLTIEFQQAKTLTGDVLKECISFTKGSVHILHPKYSFFFMGLMLMHEHGGRYGGNMSRKIGFLMLLAAPVAGFFRIGGGLLGTTIGAIGTTILAPVYGVEKIGQKITGANRLDDPHEQKMALTKAFVDRMCESLMSANFGEGGKQFFVENPQELIALSGIALAFASRNEEWGKLKIKDGSIIDRSHIEVLDELSKAYFRKIVEMKRVINDLSPDWEELIFNLDALSTGSPLRNNLRKMDIDNYNTLSKLAHELGANLCNDPDFQTAWFENPNLPAKSSSLKNARARIE